MNVDGKANPIFPAPGTRAAQTLNMLCRGNFVYKASARGQNVREWIAALSSLKILEWPIRESHIEVNSVILTVCSLEQWARRIVLDRNQ